MQKSHLQEYISKVGTRSKNTENKGSHSVPPSVNKNRYTGKNSFISKMTRLINSILMITANTITIITSIVGTTITAIYISFCTSTWHVDRTLTTHSLHPKKSPKSKTPQPTKHKFLSPIAATKLKKQESPSVHVHAYTCAPKP